MHEPPQAVLKQFFRYQDGKLFWIAASGYNKNIIGKETGYPGLRGCLETRFQYKLYKTHRLIWILLNGAIPENCVVDHIDGNGHNNKIENLRAVPQRINAKNQAKRINNKSGCTGVYWSSSHQKWCAEIKIDYKKKYLGIFTNKEEAIRVRQQAEIAFGFSSRHGK